MNRRDFMGGLMVAGLSGCAQKTASVKTPAVPRPASSLLFPTLAPIRAEKDRIFRVTVCLRPFRAAGPRLDVEQVGEKTVVHNYGHGGSGWSLSWGSSRIAVDKALASAGGDREIAVIGCGALGLTSATLLQRAGAKVTIYAKDRPPEVRSSLATGTWSPDSRVALANAVPAGFPALWEKMCRYSFHTYENYLGLAGNPVEWTDRYFLSDDEQGTRPLRQRQAATKEELDFARYGDMVKDLAPGVHQMPEGSHPFPSRFASRTSSLSFNVVSLSKQLMTDFFVEGGRMERVEFQSPSELTRISQKVIVNCTGYGARALWKDESIVPVRGQIAWLIPQQEANYGVMYKGVMTLARRDGIVVQAVGSGEMEGYNDANETPNRAEAEAAVDVVAELFSRMKTKTS